MGRRVTSSTKGGRYMNPADQERKANRKRELKKNKKQRLLVRQAVLKSKDPQQIVVEMEKLDTMEFNPNETPPLSERVIQEKRNKLRETFTRVMGMYRRENENDKFLEMKKILQDYDRKRTQMEQHYVAVKFAREVDPGEIPLPDAAPPPPDAAAAMTPIVAALHHIQQQGPFPPHLMIPGAMPPFGTAPNSSIGPFLPGKFPAHGILKKAKQKSLLPPGVPLGVAPALSDDEIEEETEDVVDDTDELDEQAERTKKISVEKPARVRFDGETDDIDDDLDEKDTRSKYKELAKKLAAGERVEKNLGDEDDVEDDEDISDANLTTGAVDIPVSLGSAQSMRPVPIPSFDGSLRPPMPHLGMPPRLRPGMRMPPLPPGFPPTNFQRQFIGPAHPSLASAAATSSGAVLSAPPVVTKPVKPAGPIIEAKPQLRNMQHEVTKLVPTSVKVKRDTHAAGTSNVAVATKPSRGPIVFRTPTAPGTSSHSQPQNKSHTTDDAYDQFMKEMQGFM